MRLALLLAIILIHSFAFSQGTQSEKAKGIEFYKAAKYGEAIIALKEAAKTSSNDIEVWYFLGASYLDSDKLKEAEKAFKRALEINASDSQTHAGLAYCYLLKNKSDLAKEEAEKAIKANKNNPMGYYALGVISLRNRIFSAAYEHAKKAIQLNPKLPGPYVLKSEALVGSFAQQSGTVVKPPGMRNELLKEAIADLEKYLETANNSKSIKYYQERLESLKFFWGYYKEKADNAALADASTGDLQDKITPLKVISKPSPPYTPEARRADVNGSLRLLVGFSADGTIKHIIAISYLGFGLDEQAVEAAKRIKFEPATKDGKPISVVKTLEYNFLRY